MRNHNEPTIYRCRFDQRRSHEPKSEARELLGRVWMNVLRNSVLIWQTIKRLEQDEDPAKGKFAAVLVIRKALSDEGVHFIDKDPNGYQRGRF